LQCVNAMKRLTATYINKSNIPYSEGGAASFLDISRAIFALHLDLASGNEIDPGGREIHVGVYF
jgi:hypothetical protein